MYLFVLPTDAIGGAERVAKLLAHHLLSRGKKVVVLFLTKPKYNEWDDLSSEFEKFEIKYLKAKRQRLGLLSGLFFLGNQRFHTVYSTTLLVNAYLSFLRKIRFLKCVRMVTRESTDVFKRFKGPHRVLASVLYKFYGAQDLMIYQTTEMKYNCESNVPHLSNIPNLVVRNPVSVLSVSQGALQESNFVAEHENYEGVRLVFVGRLCSVKNPQLLIRALHEYRAKYNERFKCVILGNGELYREIDSLIKSLGLVDNVILLGRLSNPFPIMRWADIGILTSWHEGFPNVINEMLCSGTDAILTTNCVGGLESIPSLKVCDSFAPSDIAKSLSALVKELQVRDDNSRLSVVKSRDNYIRSIDISFFYDKVF